MADNKEERPSACAQEAPPYRPTEALSDQPLPTSKSSKMPNMPTVPTVVTDIKDGTVKDDSITDTGSAELNPSENVDSEGEETQKGAGGELPPPKHSSFVASKIDTIPSRVGPKASRQPSKLGKIESVAMKILPKKTTSTISEDRSVPPSAPLEIKESDSETIAAMDAEGLERSVSSSHQDDIPKEELAWDDDEVRRRFYSGI